MTSLQRPRWQLDCQQYSTQQSHDLRFRRHSQKQILKLTHDERMRMTDPDWLELDEIRQQQRLQTIPQTPLPSSATLQAHIKHVPRRRPGDLGYTPKTSTATIVDFHSKVKPKVDSKPSMRQPKHTPSTVRSYHLPDFKAVKSKIDQQPASTPRREPVKIAYGIVRRRDNVPRAPKPVDTKQLYRRRRELQREATQNALAALRQSRQKVSGKGPSSSLPML
eukprot:m.552 g.552  ORF g.552 m.552 type:complete len:221 (-) comp774_c0_seq1:29-691(-)